MSLDWFALWMGRIVIVAGGIAVATCLFWIAVEYAWKTLGDTMNLKDIEDAVREWKVRHPQKYANWKRRNGVE